MKKSLWRQLGDVVRHRELLWNLVVRDLRLRYRNSVLGFLWSLVNPLLLMLVFTVVFGIIMPNVEIAHFPVFVLSALLPWNFTAGAIMGAVTSITNNGNIIKRVYFPREILTASTVLSGFVNFLLAMAVLLGLILVSGLRITPAILYLPFVMGVHLVFTMGVSLVLAALNVYYRDTGVIMEVVLQAWFFLTPVFYPIELLPQWITILGREIPARRAAYILNPMASIIATYRSALYGFIDGSPPGPPALDFITRTAVTALLVFLIGYALFVRLSRGFAEQV